MFDNLRTIIDGFTGKLKDAPTLRKWFWVFVAAQLFTLIVLWYNAFMSLNFYQKMLERFADLHGDFLPYLVTISIALIAYFLISSITATSLDYFAGRKYKTEGHEPMFIAAIIGLIALLFLDIYANLQGVDFVSYKTTTAVMANPLDNLGAEFEARRTNAKETYEPQIQKLEAQIAAIKDTRKAAQAGHNRSCKSTCPYKPGTGAVHWNGAITPFGSRLIAELQGKIEGIEAEYKAELSAIRSEQATKTEAAKDDYHRDKSRFDLAITDKQSGHRKLVYFAYALAILLSFVSNHYSDRAVAAIHPEREAELMAAHETRQDRQTALTAAHRARYQQGNADTMKVMQQILAQMDQSGHTSMPQQSDPISKPYIDQIGFRQMKPETLDPVHLEPLLKGSEERILDIWKKIEEKLDEWEAGKNEDKTPGNILPKNKEKIHYISDPGAIVEYHTKEIVLDNTHPRFSKKFQPDRYRSIDSKKYDKFLKVARESLKKEGKYVRARIAEKASLDPKSVSKYYKKALEKGDLEA
ncbi:MAG: hypothetical protein R8P61_32975 [Bacteroidia bacterium]|nr:hypothetical protein [Bacteroidia bacterium]